MTKPVERLARETAMESAVESVGETRLVEPRNIDASWHVTRPRFESNAERSGEHTVEHTVKTTILVPAYNEEVGLAVVLQKILGVVDDDYEVIVVDDGSSDRTRDVAAQFPVRLVAHATNCGKGQAIITGIGQARGESVIWIDADDTYPAEVIPQIAGRLANGTDLVYTSRTYGRGNIPPLNRLGNAMFRLMVKHLHGFTPFDPCSGLCGVRKSCLDAMGLESQGFGIECEIAAKAGRMRLCMEDIPIVYGTRIGFTKLNAIRDGLDISRTLLKHVWWSPPSKVIQIGDIEDQGKQVAA